MQGSYFLDTTFSKKDVLEIGEYDNCHFDACNLSEFNLSNYKFINSTFNSCNLSLIKLNRTVLTDVFFKDCKMLGLRFDTCNEFGLSFKIDGCQLSHSSFFNTKMKKMIFSNSQLEGVDFSEADLSEAIFDNCNLAQAVFDKTNLEKADFRTSYNYTIDLEKNKIKKARFSLSEVAGLLSKYDIRIEK